MRTGRMGQCRSLGRYVKLTRRRFLILRGMMSLVVLERCWIPSRASTSSYRWSYSLIAATCRYCHSINTIEHSTRKLKTCFFGKYFPLITFTFPGEKEAWVFTRRINGYRECEVGIPWPSCRTRVGGIGRSGCIHVLGSPGGYG